MGLSASDRTVLLNAVQLLESSNFLVRASSVLGRPIEKMVRKLPDPVAESISEATEKALQGALWVAERTTRSKQPQPSWDKIHKIGTTVAGLGGGFFGIAGATIELPFTTTVILRSILDISRSEGADIGSSRTRLECLNVFAFGGPSPSDDASETSYFTVRAGLAALTQRAADYLATSTGRRLTAQLNRYLAAVAGRYAPIVSQKVAAQSIPLLGALGGAVINLVFTDFFQDKARGHFIVLRMQKQYGEDFIKEEYERIAADIRSRRRR